MPSKRPKLFNKIKDAVVSRTRTSSLPITPDAGGDHKSSSTQPDLAVSPATIAKANTVISDSSDPGHHPEIVPPILQSTLTSTSNQDGTSSQGALSHGISAALCKSSGIDQIITKDPTIIAEDQTADLWERAYQLLAKEKKSLVGGYERILSLEEAEDRGSGLEHDATATTITHSKARLTDLASKKLADLDESRWKIRMGEKTIVMKDGMDQILTVLLAAKDFVSSAVTSEPTAALAWTGVCLLLPFLLNPKAQHEAATTGLLEIPVIIRRYQVLEDVYCKRGDDKGQLKYAFEEKLVQLYCKILQYQAQAICQWSRIAALQYVRDVFEADGWSKLFKRIQELDSNCKEIALTMDAGMWERAIDRQNNQLRYMLSDWYSQQQKVLGQLQDTAEASLLVAEMQKREKQMWEERIEKEKCHQVFGPSRYVEHKNHNPSRVPGTCRWFLDHESFLDWQRSEESRLLWVSADPGCGKSVLAKSLIDEELLFKGSSSPTVCYFFFKDSSVEQQGAERCISALLHQIFHDRPGLIKHALADFRKDGEKISSSFTTIWNVLLRSAEDPEAGQIVCLLDALDECEETSRYLIIDTLKRFYGDQGQCALSKLKFLVTSRPYEDIQRRFRALTRNFPTIHLKGEQESEAISEEINLVIQVRVPEIAIELDLSPDVEKSLLQRLLGITNRTYLWLHLTLEEVVKSTGASTSKRLGELISTLPETVNSAYDKILARAADPVLCRRMFHIILAAVRPLTLSEINIALHIMDDAKTIADLDLEGEANFERTVRSLCGLFISVFDKKIFLIHQTAREYLLGQNLKYQPGWKHTFSPKESNSIILNCCLVYLGFTDFEMEYNPGRENATLIEIESMERTHAFLSYSALSWIRHFKVSTPDERTLDLVSDLCNPHSKNFLTWIELFIHQPSDQTGYRHMHATSMERRHPAAWSQLMVLIYLQFQKLVPRVLNTKPDVDQADNYGFTAICTAAELGDSDTVEMLLHAGANPDLPTKSGWRALHFAVREGHKNVVRILLDTGADLNAKSNDGTPLTMALAAGHIEILHLLLEQKYINVNVAGGIHGTALQSTVASNDTEKAKLLLSHGADVNLNGICWDNTSLGPPIALAVVHNHTRILSLLLEQDRVDVNVTGGSAVSALWAAVEHDRHEMIPLLIESGADLKQRIRDDSRPESEGIGIFDLAALENKTEIMRLLLRHKPEQHPEASHLALQAAVEYGSLQMFLLVLDTARCLTAHTLLAFMKTLEDASEVLATSLSSTGSRIQLDSSTNDEEETRELIEEIAEKRRLIGEKLSSL